MNAPLFNALMTYSKTNYPYHMPGHKLGHFGVLKTLDLWKLDVTEARGLDNLYEAEGIIQEAQQEMAYFYGAKETIFLTNGATAGILAAMLTVCKPGDKLLVSRNCHHSVWHGLILGGIIPIYILPEYDEATGLLTVMTAETVEQALATHPDVKGAIIVSPTYEGIVSDIAKISTVLHDKGKCLIVDEAHGAHFGVHPYFPTSSVRLGADFVIQSMHKTMPTLTQSALLHLGTTYASKEVVIRTLRMVQTSSPSYVMMAVMDYARAYVEAHQQELEDSYIDALEKCRMRLKDMKHLKLLETGFEYDKGKIILLTKDAGITGFEVSEYLATHHLIVEGATPNTVILMTTLADGQESLMHLADLLIDYDGQLVATTLEKPEASWEHVQHLTQEMYISPRDAYYNKEALVDIDQVMGMIAKETIMFYPPGVPLICIGEVFGRPQIEAIKRWHKNLSGIQYDRHKIICKVTSVDLK